MVVLCPHWQVIVMGMIELLAAVTMPAAEVGDFEGAVDSRAAVPL